MEIYYGSCGLHIKNGKNIGVNGFKEILDIKEVQYTYTENLFLFSPDIMVAKNNKKSWNKCILKGQKEFNKSIKPLLPGLYLIQRNNQKAKYGVNINDYFEPISSKRLNFNVTIGCEEYIQFSEVYENLIYSGKEIEHEISESVEER